MGTRFTTAADRREVTDAVITVAEGLSVRLTPVYDRPVPAHYREHQHTGAPADEQAATQADSRAGGGRFAPADQVVYTSQDILDAEHHLLAAVENTNGPVVAGWVINRHTQRPVGGVRLAGDQVAAMTQLARSGRVVDVLVGPAGAGKTTALRALTHAWATQHGRASVVGLAPSAAAADVLGDSLGIKAENTAKFLHDHHHGHWNLRKGQLVLVDEASLAGTRTLEEITRHAEGVGAKVVLIGDWAQLSSVETGGAFGMLTRHLGADAAELTGIHRFSQAWEKTATSSLRTGNPNALEVYERYGRIHDGLEAEMVEAVYTAWQHDQAQGVSALMIAATAETVTILNQRARTDLITAGAVEADGVALRDGSTAGAGDVIVTRRNNRQLTTGVGSWVKNGDRWQVTARHDDGALTVRRLGKHDQAAGAPVLLPAEYVEREVELGYATTTHRAQGVTVDTAHALIDPETASRELFYVAMTRGRHTNHAYVIQPDTSEVEEHLPLPEPRTGTEQLTRVLARSDADLSATETQIVEADRHVSLDTLLAEYDLLAGEARRDHYQTLLARILPEPVVQGIMADDTGYQQLEDALEEHALAGHDPERVLNALTPHLGQEREDPAGWLAARVAKATRGLPRQRSTRPRVAGLIPTPPTPTSQDMHEALTARRELIETRARALAQQAVDADEEWTKHLGQPPAGGRARAAWMGRAATVALYRHQHGITSTAPLGEDRQSRDAGQYRQAQTALNGALPAQPRPQPDTQRDSGRRDQQRSL